MDELRKKIWHEAVRDAIGTFFSKHPDLDVPLTIECLDMKEATPIGESGQLNSLPRILHLEIKVDDCGNLSWTDNNYPEGFRGGIVRFITKGDDMCEELDIDLGFPAEENHANGTTQSGPVAEGAAAAA
jgi:hypothetical protein